MVTQSKGTKLQLSSCVSQRLWPPRYLLGKDDDTAGESQGSNGYHPGHHHVHQLGNLRWRSVEVTGPPQCGQGTSVVEEFRAARGGWDRALAWPEQLSMPWAGRTQAVLGNHCPGGGETKRLTLNAAPSWILFPFILSRKSE